MELAIIDFFQNYFFQGLIYFLSYAGHLFVVMGVAMVIYLVIDKELGAKTLVFYFTSMLGNAYLKEWIGRERPVAAGANQIIENSMQPSMPSGHTQGLAAFLFPVARKANRRNVYLICAAVLLFVCFSRIYLGQHYLSDVLVGAAVGLAIAVLLELVYVFAKDRANLFLLGLIPVSIGLMLAFPDYRDAFVSAGVLCGTLIGINLETKFVGYKVSGSILNRTFKVLTASVAGGVLMSPFVLLYTFEAIPANPGIFAMFFMLTLAVTLVCPLMFTKVKFFDRVFNKKELSRKQPEELPVN